MCDNNTRDIYLEPLEMVNAVRSHTGFVGNKDVNILQIVSNVILSGICCFLGIIFNVINIIVFIKQGLNNTVNVSMFAIAISDLCSLVTLEWLNININPFMDITDVPYEPSEIPYLTGGWPHACFLQITIWITVYVTAERFVCIALPLKVKQIFTPLRTKVIISLIYLLMFLALSPEYVTFYFGENFYLARNQTRVGLKVRDSTPNLDNLVFMLFAVMGLVSFFILSLFTCLLVVTLKQRLQWRKKSTADKAKQESMSRRDAVTMKMVSLVAGVLIICAAPGMFLSLIVSLVPSFHLGGQYRNVALVIWTFAFLAEAINSTVNIVFFYKMSSKYRHILQWLLARCISGCH